MKVKIKLFAVLLGLLLLSVLCTDTNARPEKITLYFFWGEGCPHCTKEKPFLKELEKKYSQLEIKDYEVWYHQENAELFAQMAKAYGKEARGVPTTFLADKVWIGWTNQVGKEIEEKVKSCTQQGCIDPIQKIDGTQKEKEASRSPEKNTPGKDITPEKETVIKSPFIGEVDLSSMFALAATVLIVLWMVLNLVH